MRQKKQPFRLLISILSFLLATSGLAQGFDVCQGKCCETARKAGHKEFMHAAPSHEGSLVNVPVCHIHNGPAEKTFSAFPKEDPCAPVPECCHLKKAEQKKPGLISPASSSCTDRLPQAGVHSILSDCHSLDRRISLAIAAGAVHPRAAPVPLYLKNASFLC